MQNFCQLGNVKNDGWIVLSDLPSSRIKTSVVEELPYVKDKEEQSRLVRLIVRRYTIVKQFRDMNAEENKVSEREDDAHSLTGAFDKAIIALRSAMSRLSSNIENIEENWIAHEILIQHKNSLHSQIDLLLKQKKKLVACNIV